MESLADFLNKLDGVSEEDIVKLDALTKGELGKLQGSSIYEPTVKLIATMYAAQKAQSRTFKPPQPECPHGFRMAACNRCLADEGIVPLDTRRG